MTKRKIILIGIVLILFIPLLTSVYVKGEINNLTSYKATSIPNIDGTFTEAEWSDAYHTSFFHEPDVNHPDDYVHIYMKNTQTKLYMLFDDLPDNTTETYDYVDIYFDCNYDDIGDSNISMHLSRDHTNGHGESETVEWNLGFGSSPNKLADHTIIEIAINITFSSVYDGSSSLADIGYVLPVGNSNSTIRIFFIASVFVSGWQIPQSGNYMDPTTYADLTLYRTLSNISFGTPILIGGIMIIAITAISLIISKKIKTI